MSLARFRPLLFPALLIATAWLAAPLRATEGPAAVVPAAAPASAPAGPVSEVPAEAPIAIPRAALPTEARDEADQSVSSLPPPDSTGTANNQGTANDLHWPIPAASPSINPDGNGAVTFDELVQNVAHNKISLNVVWVLGAGCLTLLMAAGLGLMQTGLGRVRGAGHTLGLNLAVFAASWLGFWIAGFALLFGGYGDIPAAIGWQPALGQGLDWLNREFAPRWLAGLLGKPIGLWGYRGFFLGHVFDTAVFALFFLQAAILAVAALIPVGALAERWNGRNALLYAFWFAAVPYAVFGNWIWGGGWLTQLGVNYRLGHGVVDFSGALVVHLAGGMVALVGAALVGPRFGKFNRQGRPLPLPAHHLPMVFLGVLLVAVGAVGLNAGATFSGTSARIAVIAVNTILAGAAGAFAAYVVISWKYGKPDPSLLGAGLLAGVVSIAGGGAFVNALGAVLIGAVAGALVIPAMIAVESRLRIDDPAGAISIHGLGGAWGGLAVGLFANGSYGRGFNGVHHLFKDGHLQILINDGAPETLKNFAALTSPDGGWTDQGVTGLLGPLFGGASWDVGQFIAQGVGVAVCVLFVGGLAWAWFRFSGRLAPVRIALEEEQRGIDASQVGVEAYPGFQVTDRGGAAGL